MLIIISTAQTDVISVLAQHKYQHSIIEYQPRISTEQGNADPLLEQYRAQAKANPVSEAKANPVSEAKANPVPEANANANNYQE